jgi:hypothetical protein
MKGGIGDKVKNKKRIGVCTILLSVLILFPVISGQINVNSPVNGKIYDSISVLLGFDSSVKGNFYLAKTNDARDGVVLCKNAKSCNSIIKAKEGENHLWIKRINSGDVEFSDEINFFIDSISPKISKLDVSYLGKAYSNGKDIAVSYSEKDLKKVELSYGLDSNIGNIISTSKTNCESGEKKKCSFSNVNLSGFENQKIDIWFTLSDSVNSVVSKKTRVTVDTISPIIETANYTVKGSGVIFSVKVNEKNLKEISYRDYSDCYDSGERTGILCTKLNANKNCNANKNFCAGLHRIVVIARDLAGNEDSQEFSNVKIDK